MKLRDIWRWETGSSGCGKWNNYMEQLMKRPVSLDENIEPKKNCGILAVGPLKKKW